MGKHKGHRVHRCIRKIEIPLIQTDVRIWEFKLSTLAIPRADLIGATYVYTRSQPLLIRPLSYYLHHQRKTFLYGRCKEIQIVIYNELQIPAHTTAAKRNMRPDS